MEKSKEIYYSLFENMLNGSAFCKMEYDNLVPVDFIYLDVNQAFAKLTGLKNVIGKRVTEVIPGIRESDPELFEIYGRVASTGKAETFEMHVKALNEWFAVSVYSPQKEYFVAVFDVISDRIRIAEALKQSEQKYRSVVEDQTEIISRFKPDGTYIFVNDVYCRFFGKRSEELIGNKWFPEASEEDLEEIKAKLNTMSPVNPVVIIENRVYSHKRDHRWFQFINRGFYSSAGELLEIQSVGRDITDKKLAEEKIRLLLEEKELILQEVHHRIKNNMSNISSLLSLQARATVEPAVIAALKDAGSRVRNMMILYDKLYQSSNFNDVRVSEYFSPLIDQILQNFPNCGSIKVEKKLGEFVLDSKKLSSLAIILNEMLSNIMKYAFIDRNTGKIMVSATLKENKVCVIIDDDGVGMPETVNFESSTGFGLRLVDSLVKQLRGTIRIERMSGTRVVIEFVK